MNVGVVIIGVVLIIVFFLYPAIFHEGIIKEDLIRFEIHERPEPKTPCPTSRSYKILEVSKNYKMSKESQIIFDQFIKHNLGVPWTDSEEYQRGLVIDKIMEDLGKSCIHNLQCKPYTCDGCYYFRYKGIK